VCFGKENYRKIAFYNYEETIQFNNSINVLHTSYWMGINVLIKCWSNAKCYIVWHSVTECFIQMNCLQSVSFDRKNGIGDYERTFEHSRIYQLDHVELYDFGEE